MPDARLDSDTLHVSRIFDASPERVFDAWVKREQFVQWMCPPGVEVMNCEVDVRPGGAWRIGGRNADGAFALSGIYREVVRPERLVFTWAHHSEGGFAGKRGHETTVRIELRVVGAGTELTLVHGPFVDDPSLANHQRGWDGSFGKLEAFFRRAP